MMEWFGAAALLPLLVGVAMCLIPMLLALFGLLRVGQMWQASETGPGGPGRCGGHHDGAAHDSGAHDRDAHDRDASDVAGAAGGPSSGRMEPTGAHR